MKRDLDRLMAERNIDAIVVEGPDGLGGANPDFNYFVQGAHLTGTVIKKRGEPAVLLHSPWEQIQAEATGLALIPTNRWNKREILSETGDRFLAEVELRRRIFTDLGVGGRVGFYGTVPASQHFALLTGLAQKLPGLEIVAEFDKDIISQARLTKEPEEIAIMRRVGQKTCAAVQAVVDFIQTGRADGDTLVDANGTPMTIGHVKQLLRRELAGQGLEDPMGTIFAQGRDLWPAARHGRRGRAAQARPVDRLRYLPARAGRRLLPRYDPHLCDRLCAARATAALRPCQGRVRPGRLRA